MQVPPFALRRPISYLAAASALLSGCVNVDFKEPVGAFTQSMSIANGVIGSYFIEMNDFERELYLQRALYDASLSVEAKDASGLPTGLLPVFSAESIKARTDSIALLTAYGERLAALAGADAPARFNAGSAVLGTNLIELVATFTKLSGPDAKDPTAAAYIEPVTTIFGVLGEMAVDARRDEALIRAVRDGAPAVETILGQLEKDLDTVIEPLQQSGQLQRLNAARLYYNTNRSTMSFEQRQLALAEIDSAAAKYQAAVVAEPSEAVDGIRDAHAALVKYADSPRQPQDLSALIDAIETFNARLEPVVESLKKLQES